ncbi:MAG TPA: S26 family signal peptidase [Puia sp.]|nr:S26 family signal peptidase [Puia sp.]
MPIHQLVIILIIQLLILLLPAVGIYKMFEKAGVAGWKALVPFYNTWIMLELANRRKYIFFFQFVPVAGWFISMSIFVDFVKTFGKFKLYEHAMSALLPIVYFSYLGFNKQDKFIGAEAIVKHKKSAAREWADAAVFAVVAATLIRAFVFESYAIPSGSMEKTMLVNDYLFANKLSYGPRIPNTPLALPFVHNKIPFINTKSYVDWIQLPYTRWFASPVKRNDVVIFNLPIGDTVVDKEEFGTKDPYYDVIRRAGNGNSDEGRKIILSNPDEYPIIVHTVDKTDNYVKRCVAIAGDNLEIKKSVVYINGKQAEFPPKSETYYYVETGGQPLDETAMKEEYDVDMNNSDEFQTTDKQNVFRMLLTADAKEKMQKNGLAKNISLETYTEKAGGLVFPYDNIHKWTIDDFGPIWVPKKGETLTLTADNYALYERAIRTYEGNKFESKDGKFYINDKQANQYTFKMDYFWMMGDNRHDSQDSRYWGFVPEDRVVGKASLIFMSWDKGPRWNRILKSIK